MSGFTGDLVVRLLQDDKAGLWKLVAPMSYLSAATDLLIEVPVGFETDFCSIPRLPVIYELLGNRARRAGSVHDFLYSTHKTDRITADELLHEMCLDDGLSSVEAEMVYMAVREFGINHW